MSELRQWATCLLCGFKWDTVSLGEGFGRDRDCCSQDCARVQALVSALGKLVEDQDNPFGCEVPHPVGTPCKAATGSMLHPQLQQI